MFLYDSFLTTSDVRQGRVLANTLFCRPIDYAGDAVLFKNLLAMWQYYATSRFLFVYSFLFSFCYSVIFNNANVCYYGTCRPQNVQILRFEIILTRLMSQSFCQTSVTVISAELR